MDQQQQFFRMEGGGLPQSSAPVGDYQPNPPIKPWRERMRDRVRDPIYMRKAGCIALAAALVVVIVIFIAVSETKRPNNSSVELNAMCLEPVGGGGRVGSGGSFPAGGSSASGDCVDQLADYFNNGYNNNYWQDVARVTSSARAYFGALPANQQQVVVFDIDETALSNSEFFGLSGKGRSYGDRWTQYGYWDGKRRQLSGLSGTRTVHEGVSVASLHAQHGGDAWAASGNANAVLSGGAGGGHAAPPHIRSLLAANPSDAITSATLPALQAVLELYNGLYNMGFSVSFVTGRMEQNRTITASNLAAAGYGSLCPPVTTGTTRPLQPCYVALQLRADGDLRLASVIKPELRMQLASNFTLTITGSIGDQFSDLVGDFSAPGSFKLPNPMYYIL